MSSSIAIVGDVHGALEPLGALVQRLALRPDDHLVFVGDLLDKGPDCAGVVRFIRDLKDSGTVEVTLVEGNHEDRHRRFHDHKRSRPGTAAAMALAAPELGRLDKRLSQEDRSFLASAQPFLRIPEWGVLVVHGGIPGTMEAFPNSLTEASALAGKARSQFRKVLRTRYINATTGGFISYGREKPGDPFWAERYDGRFGHVVFGHQPFIDGPACYPHATGVDTAAIHGGRLTALVLPRTGQPRFESVDGIAHRPFRHAAQPTHPGTAMQLKRLA